MVKIPTITQETIDTVVEGDGYKDAEAFRRTHPEFLAVADRLRGEGVLATDRERYAYLSGATFLLSCIEEQLGPDLYALYQIRFNLRLMDPEVYGRQDLIDTLRVIAGLVKA